MTPPFDASSWISRRSVVMTTRGVVAASQPLAAQAGLQIMLQGGNAADAAVATAAALNVVEPMSTGIGGDCFALYWDAKARTVTALNGSGRSPAGASRERLRAQGMTWIPTYSAHAVTVPGTVRAWEDFLARHGCMSLAEVLAPAIRYAEEGWPVSELIARGWATREPSLRKDGQASAQEYLLAGRAPRWGEVMRLPTLAATLRAIAEGGADAFYRGEIAGRIAAYLQQHGSPLTAADLENHHSTWDEPIYTDYRGVRVYQCPPNGQGLATLLALNILEGWDLPALGWGSGAYLHRLIEAMRMGFADARQHVTDPAFYPVPLQRLLSREYADMRRAAVGEQHVHVGSGVHVASSDTVYLATADKDGNACSFINSLYHGFGSGYVVPGTGIILQNRGASFYLDDEHPNRLEPNKRPYHTIIPGMATRAGELYAAFGVMGGFMQPQGHLQVLVNMLDFGMDPQRALDAPRFYIMDGRPENVIALEEGTAVAAMADLAARGHPVRPINGYERLMFGGGQIIRRDPEQGVWLAGSEPRKDGCAVAY